MSPVSKTCQSCADSKVRCVRGPVDTDACNRCRRLGKECLNRQTGRRFRGFQKDRKIAALESKINELTVDRAGLASKDIPTPFFDGKSALQDFISRGFLALDTAERYLSNFKAKMIPSFPFVVICSSLPVEELRQTKPFLFSAIMAAASYENMSLQRALGHEFKKTVASRMIVDGEVSFELLQGLLVFLAWSHYHSKPHRYTQFLQLAVSLVTDLRLDRPPQTKMWKTGLRFGPRDNLQDPTLSRPSWGSDEQRAVLGCYYLSASIAMLVQKSTTMIRFPYQEECCKALLEANEYPHDRYINYIIQLQLITEKIDKMSAKHAVDLEKPGSGSELYIANLKADMEAFRRHLTFDIHESPLLAIQYHATGLCLYQLALNFNGQQPWPLSDTWRDEMSVSIRVSAMSILNTYLQLPARDEVGFNNTQWVQMGFALLAAYRHTVATWTPEQTASFLSILSKLESRIGALCTLDKDANGARDVFFDFKKRVVRIKSWVEELENRQRHRSHTRAHDIEQQQTSCHTDINRFMEVTELAHGSSWDALALSAPDSQLHSDFFFGPSFDQIMGNW
ncbi:Zn(II)2Cys6 transcription factor [Aspergillus stella-maris]|uniref:Zn(II)2Cys6 transcription factor n=1 Tax=Aspergillus stella-maris TaxID=1810926 RepID=UPI003CCDFC01